MAALAACVDQGSGLSESSSTTRPAPPPDVALTSAPCLNFLGPNFLWRERDWIPPGLQACRASHLRAGPNTGPGKGSPLLGRNVDSLRVFRNVVVRADPWVGPWPQAPA